MYTVTYLGVMHMKWTPYEDKYETLNEAIAHACTLNNSCYCINIKVFDEKGHMVWKA